MASSPRRPRESSATRLSDATASTPLIRVLGGTRDVLAILAMTLLLFVGVELLLSIVPDEPASDPDVTTDRRTDADTYRGATWPHDYYREFHEAHVARWTPYVYWRHAPYDGHTVRIDARGIRHSWTPPGAGDRPAIYFFGGSTMWGTGARDDATIPSLVARRLDQRGLPVDVVNFGESGYVSTQEMILLLRLLQTGDVPDVVVFYDGVNDSYSAYQQGQAGLPQNEYNRIAEFNSSKREPAQPSWSALLSRLRTTRLLTDRLRASQPDATPPGHPRHEATSELVDAVLDTYATNVAIVRSLADRYGFAAHFFWQPHLFEKRSRTAYENAEVDRFLGVNPGADVFLDRVYQAKRRRDLVRRDPEPVHDLSRLFADRAEPLFVDWCHLGETGNQLVAERI
ncbi:MAG: SGNH/GDSL hydrolase family protein, partial [Acidobacteriota bacterium]